MVEKEKKKQLLTLTRTNYNSLLCPGGNEQLQGKMAFSRQLPGPPEAG